MNDKGIQRRGCRRIFPDCFALFEQQVLVFPLLATALASITLIFGGRCAAWQWWAAVVAVMAGPFLKRGGWRMALGAAGLFAALLLALRCLLPPVLWDSTEFFDMPTYHLPTAQLLIEGWNPMSDPLAEGICSRLGLDVWGMAPLQVAFMPKTLAIFAAVAYQFVGDPTGLTVPGLALLWLGVALQTMRATRGLSRMAVLAALIWILPLVHYHVHVDLVLAFAAYGLLLAMMDYLNGKPCNWLSLSVWTIWMMNTKQNGVLAAFVFWILFVANVLWRNRTEWRRWLGHFSVFAVGVTLVWGLFSWNPMVTSWRLCRNPFYPFATGDAENWPVRNLNWDMRLVNEDMRQMGKAGIWVQEYISPRLARAYYMWKTGKDDFSPERRWTHSCWMFLCNWGWVRWTMWIVFAVLLLFPQGRLCAVGGLLLSILVPKEYIGYMRYFPWMSSMGCLAVVIGAEWAESKLGRRTDRTLLVGAVMAFALVGALWLWHHARDVEFKATELAAPRPRIHYPFTLVSVADDIDPNDFPSMYDYLTVTENQCRLLMKELGWDTTVLPAYGWRPYEDGKEKNHPLWTLDQRQWLLGKEERDERNLADMGKAWSIGNIWDGFSGGDGAEVWVSTPWRFYHVKLGERTDHIMRYHMGGARRVDERWGLWLMRRIGDMAWAWCQTYPREVWRWLWHGANRPCL